MMVKVWNHNCIYFQSEFLQKKEKSKALKESHIVRWPFVLKTIFIESDNFNNANAKSCFMLFVA